MSEDNVTIPRSQLEEILEQNRQFLNNQQAMQTQLNEMAASQGEAFQPILQDETKMKRKVRIAYINDVPVIGMRNRGSEARPFYIYERPHPTEPNKRVAYADLLLLGQDDAVTVNFNEFQREADAREMEIQDTKKIPWEIDQGFVQKKAWQGDSLMETAVRVPVKVKGEDRIFKFVDPKLGTFEVDEKWVNIR